MIKQYVVLLPKINDSFEKQARRPSRTSDILNCLANGLSNLEIAKELKICEKTVKNHLTRMLQKTNTSNRIQLLTYAIRKGLVIIPVEKSTIISLDEQEDDRAFIA